MLVEKINGAILLHDRTFSKKALERSEEHLLHPLLLSLARKWCDQGVKSVRIHEGFPQNSFLREIGMHSTTAWHPSKLVQELEAVSYKRPLKPPLLKKLAQRIFRKKRP